MNGPRNGQPPDEQCPPQHGPYQHPYVGQHPPQHGQYPPQHAQCPPQYGQYPPQHHGYYPQQGTYAQPGYPGAQPYGAPPPAAFPYGAPRPKKSQAKSGAVLAILCFVFIVVCNLGRSGSSGDSGRAKPAETAVPETPSVASVVDEPELECPPGKELRDSLFDSDVGRDVSYCTIPFEVATTDDRDVPAYHSRIRGLVVDEDATRGELIELLAWYYLEMRSEVMASGSPQKKVFIYLYPSDRRAHAGLGDWVVMVGATGEDLTETPSFQYKLPPEGAEKPSPDEDELYDDYLEALYADPEGEEKAITRRFARKRKVSVKRIEAVADKVRFYRSGGL